MTEKRPNIEKELDKATSSYAGLMASTPAEHHPQSPLGWRFLNVEPEPLTYGAIYHSAHQQLCEEAMAREVQGLVAN